MIIKGGCLCGKVRYQVAEPLFNADHCHCLMCRRQHGAAFAAYAEFMAGDLQWTSGESIVKVFEPSADAGWCFCSEFGSTLAGADKGIIATITLGTVDGDPGIKPESHIFVGSKAEWHDIRDNLPQFAERSPKTWASRLSIK